MKKGLVITLIACGVLLLVGGILFVIGLLSGGKLFFNIDFKNHRIITSSDSEMVGGLVTLDEFNKIDLNVPAAKVKLLKGDSYMIKYEVYDTELIKAEVQDKKLEVRTIKDGNDVTGFNIINNKEPYVEITVPEGTKFEECKFFTNAGNVNLDDFEIRNLTIEENAGNITLNKITSDSIEIDVNAGNVELTNSETNKLSIEVDAGNIEVSETRADNIDMESSFGSVTLGLIGEEADYGIDADVDAGSLIVNGKNKKNHYKANSDKDKKIEINASAGEVNISFK